MSILIKGMEMPESCDKCALCVNGFTDDAPMYECTASGNDMTSVLVDDHGKPFNFRPDWCPLVEVKEPHGRLIDADKLDEFKLPSEKQDFKTWHKHSAEYKNAVPTFNSALDLVKNNAPTVIEAEGSEK